MNFNDYQRLASRTRNSDLDHTEHLVNGALGLAGEAGEVADTIKKHLYQGHVVTRDQLCEELGDDLWYIADLATTLGLTLEEVARRNIEKLKARYPEGR